MTAFVLETRVRGGKLVPVSVEESKYNPERDMYAAWKGHTGKKVMANAERVIAEFGEPMGMKLTGVKAKSKVTGVKSKTKATAVKSKVKTYQARAKKKGAANDKKKEAIGLFLLGHSVKEVAGLMGISEGNARYYYHVHTGRR